jgi:hypothetical protein
VFGPFSLKIEEPKTIRQIGVCRCTPAPPVQAFPLRPPSGSGATRTKDYHTQARDVVKYFTKTWISYTGGVAKIAGPVALCLGMFFIEHFVVWGACVLDLAGKLANSAAWLLHNQARYVLGLKRHNIEPYDAFDAIHAQIKGQYDWKEFSAAGRIRIGMWVRRLF